MLPTTLYPNAILPSMIPNRPSQKSQLVCQLLSL